MSLNLSKKLLWPVCALLLLAACTQMESFNEDVSPLSDDVSASASVSEELIQPILAPYIADGRFWLVSKNPIPANTILKYGPFGHYDPASESCGTIKSPDFTAWLIYISGDTRIDGPAEDALCLFVDVSTGGYEKVPISGQVCDVEWDSAFLKSSDEPSEDMDTDSVPDTKASAQAQAAVAKYYAVIISGGANLSNNWSRYWNNCQYIYKRLTQTLGYNKNNIYCLVADGTNPADDMIYRFDGRYYYTKSSPLDFDNDGTNDIKYAATKSDISRVFNELKSKSSSIDHLLVFVTDHGTEDGKICLWNNQLLSPAELNAELNKLPNKKMDIVLGQCYSGAFVNPLTVAKNRTVATSCNANETAKSQGQFTYGYFLRAWTDAFDPAKKTAVDSNSDSKVSLREAFYYAKANDYAASVGWEHPQYKSSSPLFGYIHDLAGWYNPPVIIGDDNMKADVQYTYTLTNMPVQPSSVSWSCSGELRVVSQTQSSVKVQSTLASNQYVYDNPPNIYATVTINGETDLVSKRISSIWRSGYFFNVNKIIYTADENYIVYTGYGAYDYQWVCSNSSWRIFPPTGSNRVQITAPYNSGPAAVFAIFKNPFGETVTVGQEIEPRYFY